MVHVVYCDHVEKEINQIQDGSKTMIIRAASGRKIPHSRVFEGEKLFFMEKGTALITLTAIVKQVHNLTKLSDDQIDKTFVDYQPKLNLSKKQQERWHKQCMCLIEFDHVQPIDTLHFEHQGNMDDWLILEKIEDVLVGTSIPFTYEKSKF